MVFVLLRTKKVRSAVGLGTVGTALPGACPWLPAALAGIQRRKRANGWQNDLAQLPM